MRTCTFTVTYSDNTTELREATVRDSASLLASSRAVTAKQADLSDRSQIPSPKPGTVEQIFCSVGQKVKHGDKLMIVSAMKMAVDVNAAFPGMVKEVCVKNGERVDANSLLAVVIPYEAVQTKHTGVLE